MAPVLVAPWQLYRHFDATGTLLYVGISHNALIRLVDHKRAASWFSQIRRIEVEHFADRSSAFAAEAAAIEAERPIHNRSQANAAAKMDEVAPPRKVQRARAINSAPTLTRDRLREVLEYMPSTGRFIWKQDFRGNQAGSLAGNVCPKGYWRVSVDGRSYRTHQLAWLYVYGEWAEMIDHVNGCKVDNRLSNLRKATARENAANITIQRNNTTGFRGVVSMKGGKWGARIREHGRTRWLGTHDTPELASAAYERAAAQSFGQFARAVSRKR